MSIRLHTTPQFEEELEYLLNTFTEIIRATASLTMGITVEDCLRAIWKYDSQKAAQEALGLPSHNNTLTDFIAEATGVDVRSMTGPGTGTIKRKFVKYVKELRLQKAHEKVTELQNQPRPPVKKPIPKTQAEKQAARLFLVLMAKGYLVAGTKEEDLVSAVEELRKKSG